MSVSEWYANNGGMRITQQQKYTWVHNKSNV